MTSKATHNPHEILTDELVEEALGNDVGPAARLHSYKVVDFTKKGDNFVSFVTSVELNYDIEGEKYQRSYIAKLSLGAVPEKSMNRMLKMAYIREPIILGPVRDLMNRELNKINLSPIRIPRCLSFSDIDEKEMLLSEDLRKDGFIMSDKYKGLDLKHASFVMKELGRFHASSILVENLLKNKSFEKTYPSIADDYFTNPDFEDLPSVCKIMEGQLNQSIEIMNLYEGYDHVNKWFKNIKELSVNYLNRHSDPSEKFNVLIHGDCWINNMLFKYGKNGEPIDVRLVDLQMSRKASPAVDLNYFFYTSLTGEIRQKHKKALLVNYYLSFSEVLLLAGKDVPFTYEEFLDEVRKRLPYGCLASMLVLPTVLARPEFALDIDEFSNTDSEKTIEKRKRFLEFASQSPVVKSRILTMFDEMTDAGIFENVHTVFNPYKILTEEMVEKALKSDLGEDADFIAFEIRDFTKKGDNYATTVVCAKVTYKCEGKINNTTYVVKLNPGREVSAITELFELFYRKEPLIFSTIVDGLNTQLDALGQPPIKFPKILASTSEKSKEVFITRNLRSEGFLMYDRKKGMDVPHSLFIMKELGRLHASSLLYEETLGKPIPLQFEKEFDESWNNPETPTHMMFSKVIESRMSASIPLVAGLKKYENLGNWFNKIKDTVPATFMPRYNPENKKFNVLIHGDCWNNNILFKYDDCGNPVDVRLLDLQMSRIDSAASDLTYFFYTSLNGDVRQENQNLFLVTYYLAFCEVLILAGKTVPFSFQELQEEMKEYLLFGCISGMIVIPFVMTETESDMVSFDDISDDKLEDFLEDQREGIQTAASKSEGFVKRFLSLLDEMMEAKVIQ